MRNAASPLDERGTPPRRVAGQRKPRIGLRVARLPEGARRLGADHPHAAARRGLRIAPTYDGADLVVVNTCGFIDAAVAESLDAIGEALPRTAR
jgi:hypothetical protein